MEGEASKEETKASINKKNVSHIIHRIQERHGTSRPRRGHKRKVEQKREKIEEESNLKRESIIEVDEGNDLNEEVPTPNNEAMSINLSIQICRKTHNSQRRSHNLLSN